MSAATQSIAATHPAAAAVTAKASAPRASMIVLLAPADEYFGPLKMSILGIRNTMRDLGARYDVNHDIGHQTFTSAELTEKAIHDWEHRYPRDGQVPKAIYLLQRLYSKVLTQESRDRASATARWMFADYSSSPQGRVLKRILAVEHLPPVLYDSTPVPAAPAASDTAYPSAFGTSYPSTFSSATPAPAPASTGTPAPAPSGFAPPGVSASPDANAAPAPNASPSPR